MFSTVYTERSVDAGRMTYFDGEHTWGQCRRCGTIQAVLYYPHRLGFLVPLCYDCADEGADLLRRGRGVVKVSSNSSLVEFPFLAEDYDVIE